MKRFFLKVFLLQTETLKPLPYFFLFFTFYFLLPSSLFSQDEGYRLEVSIENYESDTVFLGFRRADKVYSKDTVAITNGKYVFEGKGSLQPGVYVILMPPDNKHFEFVVTKNDQQFSVMTKAPSFFENLKFKGSEENRLLYEYQQFMNEQVTLARKIDEQFEKETDEEQKTKLEAKKQVVNDGIKAYQSKIAQDHPDSYVAKLIAAFKDPVIPEAPLKPDGTKDEQFGFRYYKAHYWDGFDLSDEIFINTPYLKQKIDRYLEKMTVQVPDSMIVSVDKILGLAEKNTEVFRYCLPYLLNKFYKPEIMGMDKVYVHLSDNYYKAGKAEWIGEESLKKITDDAYMMRGVLLGNQAPNIQVQLYDHDTGIFTTDLISPYDVEADFTVIFLWKPGCGYCKSMTEALIPFYEEWKDKGVEIFSISSANHMDAEKACKDVKDKGMPWIVTADLYGRARAMQHYYGTSLPKIYVLDKNKKIIANRVGVPQLPDIINDYLNKEKEEN